MFNKCFVSILIFFAVCNVIHAEIFDSYKANYSTRIQKNRLIPTDMFPDLDTSLVWYADQENSLYTELRVTDKNYKIVETFNGTVNEIISPRFFTGDVTSDGYDDIIFARTSNSVSRFFLYNKDYTAPLEIFSKSGQNEYVADNLHADGYINTAGDTIMVISFNEVYPGKNSTRYILSYNLTKKKEEWVKKAGYYATDLKILYSENDVKIFVATSAVMNYFSLSNGHFYKKNISADIKTKSPDINSPDYETDSLAVIYAMDETGKVLWKNFYGRDYVWTEFTSTGNNQSLYAVVHNRGTESPEKSRVINLNPENGMVNNSYNFLTDSDFRLIKVNDKLFCTYENGVSYFITPDLHPVNKTGIGEPIQFYRYIPDFFGKQAFFGTIGENLHVYDTEMNFITSFPGAGSGTFISGVNKIYTPVKNGIKMYHIVSYPWYKSISVRTYLFMIIAFVLIIVFLLLLWVITLRRSRIKILMQKNELEEKQTNLDKTTAKLIESEKLAALGTIAASVAHEINSPLGAIINSAGRIEKQGFIVPESDRNLNLIIKAANHCKNIINKATLNTVRADGTNFCNIGNVLTDWLSLYRKNFLQKGIIFETSLSCNTEVNLSGTEATQLITNLVFNSRDSLMLKKSGDKKIIITGTEANTGYELTVQDNGGGFPDSILKNEPVPFNTTKKHGEGTGLGLWISHNIVVNAGGAFNYGNNESGAFVKISLQKKDTNNL